MEADILFWDDLRVGDVYVTGAATVSAHGIAQFVRKPERRATGVDDAIVASRSAMGWNAEALTMRLLGKEGPKLAGCSAEVGGVIEWQTPAQPGDIVHVKCEVVELSPLRTRTECGLAVLRFSTVNQRRETVLTLVARRTVRRRASQASLERIDTRDLSADQARLMAG